MAPCSCNIVIQSIISRAEISLQLREGGGGVQWKEIQTGNYPLGPAWGPYFFPTIAKA